MLKGNPSFALDYLLTGAKFLTKPGLRKFIIIPLLLNVIVSILTAVALISFFSDFLDTLTDWLPSWLAFIAWLIWSVVAFIALMIYGYSFNLITNIIAAPFYGILAAQIEVCITQKEPPEENWPMLISRTLGREILKLWYFSTRGIAILLLLFISWFIPGINLITLAISAAWGAWSMTVQYVDYPADNHQTSFRQLRQTLAINKLTSYSFGGFIMLGSLVPIINVFVGPIAVAGATVYWTTELSRSSNNTNL